ncbi:unnamed protein product [Schistosoma mattheei]|uniref:Uncharacterized protein n=1 Tax=Schistosoma mattheei TaxID=31246 RepID=A0A183PZC4_9TREM|nr:unnamed protein product [Schistosoma mattheei]
MSCFRDLHRYREGVSELARERERVGQQRKGYLLNEVITVSEEQLLNHIKPLIYQLLTQGDDTFELIQLSNDLINNLPSLVPSTSINNDNNQLIYSNYNSLSYNRQMEHPFTYHQSNTLSPINQLLPYQNRPEQLYLKVTKPLDWETKRSYQFILTAEDNGSPAFTGEMSLMVSSYLYKKVIIIKFLLYFM